VKDLSLLKRTLALALSEVRAQDIPAAISRTHTVPGGAEVLWGWMCANWEELERCLQAGMGILGTLVSLCTAGFSDRRAADRIDRFFARRGTKGFGMALEQGVDDVRARARWVQRDTEDVKTWLRKSGYLS
jgi:aminopeptidase 2